MKDDDNYINLNKSKYEDIDVKIHQAERLREEMDQGPMPSKHKAFPRTFQLPSQDPHINSVFSVGDLLQTKIFVEHSQSLEESFSLPEIELALKHTDKTKAPGLDGLNAGVLHSLWPSIKNDVLAFFNDFHSTGFIPPGCNSLFIALIPKIVNASSPVDFRPISLINVLMKLLTKVMATRLKVHMSGLVAQEQSAFIQGRQITDGILITSEIVSMLQKKQSRGLIFKIDFKKAFDRVKWSFVYEVMQAMNFGPKWLSWIKAIFESSRISVLVNVPHRNFRHREDFVKVTLYRLYFLIWWLKAYQLCSRQRIYSEAFP